MQRHHTKAIWRIIDLGQGFIASCSSDGTCKIFDIHTQKQRAELKDFSDAVNDIVYLKKFKLLAAVGGEFLVRLYSIDTGRLVKVLQGHTQPIYTLYFDE
jgi:WD40 repeat protein